LCKFCAGVPMQKRFIPSRWNRLSAVCFLGLFLAIDVATICLAIFGPDRPSRLVGGISAIFWSCWVVIAILAVVQSRYESIEIRDGSLTCHSLFLLGSKRIEISSAVSARWKIRNGGTLVLSDGSNKFGVAFEAYSARDKLWLIEFLRRAIPTSIQQNWDQFCHWRALPLRTKEMDQRRAPGPDEVLVTREHRDRISLCVFLLSVELAGSLAWFLGQPHFWIIPVAAGASWVCLRFNVSRDGSVQKRLTWERNKDADGFLLFLVVWSGVAFAGLFLCDRFWPQIPHPGILAAVGVGIWFVIVLLQAFRTDRKGRPAKARAERLAAQRWDAESWTRP
jgi:hypothetical protein